MIEEKNKQLKKTISELQKKLELEGDFDEIIRNIYPEYRMLIESINMDISGTNSQIIQLGRLQFLFKSGRYVEALNDLDMSLKIIWLNFKKGRIKP